jgi:hypothetical protein
VFKPKTPEPISPEIKIIKEETPVKVVEEVEIQAKLSLEEKEIYRIKKQEKEKEAAEEAAKKMMAVKDEYGAIAI